MKLISNKLDVRIKIPDTSKAPYSYPERELYYAGHECLATVNDLYILKNVNTNEIFKATKPIYDFILRIGTHNAESTNY